MRHAARLALTATLVCCVTASAIDQRPLSSFSYDGQRLSDAVVEGVSAAGVEISGKNASGRPARIRVPLADAKKMPALQMRVRSEMDAAAQVKSAAREAAAKPVKVEPGEQLAFDTIQKMPDGWIVQVCEPEITEHRPITSGMGSVGGGGMVIAVSPETNWVRTPQLGLLRFYGALVAEGERIVTRVEKAAPRELDFDGSIRTLRVFDVVGSDRAEKSPSSPQQ